MNVFTLLDAVDQQEKEISQAVKKARLHGTALQVQETRKHNKNIIKALKAELQQVTHKINVAEKKTIGLNHVINEILPKDIEQLVKMNAEAIERSSLLQKQSDSVLATKANIKIISFEQTELRSKIQSQNLLNVNMQQEIVAKEKLVNEMLIKHNEELNLVQAMINDEVEKGNSLEIVKLQIVSDEIANLERECSIVEEQLAKSNNEGVYALNELESVKNELQLINKEFEDLTVVESLLKEQEISVNKLQEEVQENESLLANQSKQIDILKRDVQTMKDDLFLQATNISEGFQLDGGYSKEDIIQNSNVKCRELLQCVSEKIKKTEQEMKFLELENKKLQDQCKEYLESTESMKIEIENFDKQIKEIEAQIANNCLQSLKLEEIKLLIDEQQSSLIELDAEITGLPEKHNIIIKKELAFISAKQEEIKTKRDSLNASKKHFLKQNKMIDSNITATLNKQARVDANSLKLQASYERLMNEYKVRTSNLPQAGPSEKKVTFNNLVSEREITFDSVNQQSQDGKK